MFKSMKTYLKYLKPEEIIKRLKNGEVIKMEHNEVYIKMIDGITVRFYPSLKPDINTPINLDDGTFYFETEEPFEIKETGLYKTRDGRKVFVSCIINDLQPVTGIIQGESNADSWFLSGKYAQADENPYDIISKWED